MTKRMFRRCLVSAGLAALTLTLPSLHAEGAMEGKDGAKAGWAEKGADRMKEKLGLTDAQVAKLKELHKDEGAAGKALRDKLELDRASLKVLIDKKAPDNDLSAALAALKKDREAMQEQRAKRQAAMAAILTPMQQAKMAVSMGEGREGKKEGMRHGGWHKEGPEGHGMDQGQEKEKDKAAKDSGY